MDRGPTDRFCEPWPVFEVRTVSFCFGFSGEFVQYTGINLWSDPEEMKEHEENKDRKEIW